MLLIVLGAYTLQFQAQPIPPEQDGIFKFEIHLQMYHYDPFGNLIGSSHHAGTLTNGGADYIEKILGNATDDPADYIANSNSTDAPQAAWDMIPVENNASGAQRAQGTYVGTGVGTWNITKTFSITGAVGIQLVGLYWDSGSTHTLLCADQTALVNAENGDTVVLTWMITVA